MADLKGSVGGEMHRRTAMYRDDTDGTSSETVAANQWAWDATTGGWVKVTVDHTTGALVAQVTGNVASGSADSGNPVKVGAKFNSTPPTFLDGQRADLQTGNRGSLSVQILGQNSSVGASAITSIGDGQAASAALFVVPLSTLFNETSFDRQRGNTTAALIAAGTASTQSNKQITNYNARSLAVILNVTTATTATLALTITGSSASGYTYTILTGASVVTTGTNIYRVGPGLTAVTNLTVNDFVPRNLLVTVTITGTVAYGVDYELSV